MISIFRELEWSSSSPFKRNIEQSEILEQSNEDNVLVRSNLHGKGTPILSPYSSIPKGDLLGIIENPIEDFSESSVEFQRENHSVITPLFRPEEADPAFDSDGTAANYKTEESQKKKLSTIKNLHGRKACEYFGE